MYFIKTKFYSFFCRNDIYHLKMFFVKKKKGKNWFVEKHVYIACSVFLKKYYFVLVLKLRYLIFSGSEPAVDSYKSNL